MKNTKTPQNLSTLPWLTFLSFWFFGFTVALFVFTTLINAFISISFLMYSETGLIGLLFMFLFFIFFLVPFFPLYLLIKFAYSHLHKLFPSPEKNQQLTKIILYTTSYLLGLLIFSKLAPNTTMFIENTTNIKIATYLSIFFLDGLCEKIFKKFKK